MLRLADAQIAPATKSSGIIIGNLIDADNSKAIPSASVVITRTSDSSFSRNSMSAKDGAFIFEILPNGFYRLQFTATGYKPLTIDSIHIRDERSDFDLNDIKLNKKTTQLEEVIVYAEKPLVEEKDGKIIFNTGESALSAGATTTELLKQTPLVNIDNDGNIALRGKDVKILIDDKPVELNGKQLQDLLESMPGSMIEKIEVMTTPPPQYANERGGVINIVTKKGRVGMNGRLNLNYGTRGEAGINGFFGYRKQRFSININGGFGYNGYQGNSVSNRQNIYRDSINFFNTNGASNSENARPNARLNVSYDINKQHNLNFTLLYNSNSADGNSYNEYSNINQYSQLYRLSDRQIHSNTNSSNPNFNFAYSYKGKNPKELLRVILGWNLNSSEIGRNYFQQFLNADSTRTGIDSTQQQNTDIHNHTISYRVNYDKPLTNKISLSIGTNYSQFISHNILNTIFLKKPDQIFVQNSGLSNNFLYYQNIYAFRGGIRYDIMLDFYINMGVQVEHTTTHFDLQSSINKYANNYWEPLPFATIMKKWKNEISLTVSYKRSIQRPGINELNPSVDYSDPYNRRFGNPYLNPYYSDNFDLIIGKWNKLFNVNASLGYDLLQNIYSSIRTLQQDGVTNISWQNISGRQEYHASTWCGYSVSKKARINLSLGYTYNQYSDLDHDINKFRNGGSFYSTMNTSYLFSDLLNSTASFTFNRFANPQGTVRSSLSVNLGIQRKFFKKKFVIAVNAIDPFKQQQNKIVTFGSNYTLQSVSSTQTRNFRLAVSYIFSKTPKNIFSYMKRTK